MELTVTAPNRIDLAGGTTDIFPLYLFMGGGCTVNAAISILSRVAVEKSESSEFRISSKDLNAEACSTEADGLPLEGPMGLVGRAVRSLPPAFPAKVTTFNQAPTGSGLGASSALLVALLSALLGARGRRSGQKKLIELAANVETAAIGVPAGQQDYIAAVYGGLSVIQFDVGGFFRRPIPRSKKLCETLERMIVLTYTGEGRFSGMNNWDVAKAFIDGDAKTRKSLIAIRDTARELADALIRHRVDALPSLIQNEWRLRKSLAPGITTHSIDAIMASASEAGALASKVCGAGGGGCMITVAPPERREMVQAAITEAGGTVLPFQIDHEGVRFSPN